MVETQSEQEASYNELLPKITSHPPEKTVVLTMPIEEAVAEAERIKTVVKQDEAKLRKTGIDADYIDSLAKRVGAFVWCAAIVQSMIKTEDTAAKEWEKRKPAAVEVRRLLLRDFNFAFRKFPDLLQSVKQILEGRGNRDFLLDLLSCSKLGKSNIELLIKAGADITLLDQAANLYAELSDIFARMTIDPAMYKKADSMLNKSWSYLKEALDEIYDAGRYAFDESDERHTLYYSDYFIRLGQSGAKAKALDAEEKAAVEKELTQA
jgi:hypothetical protein